MGAPVMRGVVYRGGQLELDEVLRPTLLAPTDAVVQISTAAICGSDLYIKHNRFPGVRDGSVVGHEFVGHVVATGDRVNGLREGDRVVGSCMVPCGTCAACARKDFGRCVTLRVYGCGIWTGDLDGAQTEYIRVPNAALSLKLIPDTLSDAAALPLGDVLASGLDAARRGRIQEGDTVIVHGLGPVGLFAVQAALLDKPARVIGVDPDAARRQLAEEFGATTLADPAKISELTDGGGADVGIDCVGALPALEQALGSLRPGGRLSVIGQYPEMEWTTAVAIHMQRGVELAFCGTANVVGLWDHALELVESGDVVSDLKNTVTLPLEQALDGYAAVEAHSAVKVLLTP